MLSDKGDIPKILTFLLGVKASLQRPAKMK